MQHLRQPNDWTCLPTSLAMLANTTVDAVLANIGHDGSQLDKHGPHGRRAFCDYEIILAAYKMGYWLVPILVNLGGERVIDEQTFVQILEEQSGLICGNRGSHASPHSVFWHNGNSLVYDPARGSPESYRHFNDRFNIEVFFACPNFVPKKIF